MVSGIVGVLVLLLMVAIVLLVAAVPTFAIFSPCEISLNDAITVQPILLAMEWLLSLLRFVSPLTLL